MSETNSISATQEALQGVSIPDGASPLSVDREFKFSFKKQTIKDELGIEQKRPPVTLTVPIPTFEGLVDIISKDQKAVQFILDLAEEAIKDQIRVQLSDEDKPVNRQEDLDLSKLTISFIANMPKSERTGGGIGKDTWEDFEKDYISCMVTPERGLDKITKAAKMFASKLNAVRTDKGALKFLREQLGIWATKTSALDDFAEVYKYLDDRMTDLLNRDNTSQLANLQ